MCFLVHPIKSAQETAELATKAQATNPFATGQPASAEFTPDAPRSEQAGVVDILSKLGYEAQVDPDMGTIFIKQIESCTCCSGFVNNCKGQ